MVEVRCPDGGECILDPADGGEDCQEHGSCYLLEAESLSITFSFGPEDDEDA